MAIIYTATYVDAAPVMRVSIIGLAALVFDLTSIMLVSRQGAFLMRVSMVTLVVSVAISWFSAQAFGLAGAVAGSVTAIYVDYIVVLRRVASRTGIPVRRLHDWRALGLLMLLAVLAAASAWSVVGRYFPASGPLARVIAGGVLMATVYAGMAALLGLGRGWFAAGRKLEHGL